jgi:hypothetical protein
VPLPRAAIARRTEASGGYDRERHQRVIRKAPGRSGQCALFNQAIYDIRVNEKTFTEGITNGQSFQRASGALKTLIVLHLRHSSSIGLPMPDERLLQSLPW